ncbi:MAG: transporter ATP-binding protein [Glaciihabitans sp.]|nr:transporter ATP-binding protein [Glaciihabitans sp.]
MTNTITITAASRNYGRVTALDNVSFSVPKDSICGLLGRNGAGKTTVMSLISGQDRPTSGSVEVLGHNPFEHDATLSQLSFIRDNQRYPDDYKLLHVLRIAPEFAPHWSGDVAAELVESFRIPAKTPIRKFSRGQLSAVAIVIGLASRAPITLLDEPYLGLDVTARALFYSVLLRDYAENPRTILLSTHLVEESESLFERIVIMDRGRVVVDSDVDDARNLAVVVSGHADAVDVATRGQRVLHGTRVGGLKTVTVSGSISDPVFDEAREHGLQVSAASVHDLVAALGAAESPVSLSQEEARA